MPLGNSVGCEFDSRPCPQHVESGFQHVMRLNLWQVQSVRLCPLKNWEKGNVRCPFTIHTILQLCTDDTDASLSCALLWKSIFDMMLHLLQSAGQDAYMALSSPLVNHWKLVSGIIITFTLLNQYTNRPYLNICSHRIQINLMNVYKRCLQYNFIVSCDVCYLGFFICLIAVILRFFFYSC